MYEFCGSHFQPYAVLVRRYRPVLIIVAVLTAVGIAAGVRRAQTHESEVEAAPVAPTVSDDGANEGSSSWRSQGSRRSAWSVGSVNSFCSIGSRNSAFSIGSVGSAFSVGSFASAFSIGSAFSFGSTFSFAKFGRAGKFPVRVRLERASSDVLTPVVDKTRVARDRRRALLAATVVRQVWLTRKGLTTGR